MNRSCEFWGNILDAVREHDVLIFRGISGSGKSHVAKVLKEDMFTLSVVSADHFFNTEKGYEFNPAKLSEAHKECLRTYLNLLRDGSSKIIVDNTNLHSWEISPYYNLALVFGKTPIILDFPVKASESIRRNIHGLGVTEIERQVLNIQNECLPSFWKLWKLS